MRLISDDGASIDLSIVDYQFPSAPAGRQPGDIEDWDANWLMIRGAVHTADGLEWDFTEPCLTTREAAELHLFLRQIAAPDVSGVADRRHQELTLEFTEPELAFTSADVESDPRTVEVRLSYGAAPRLSLRQPDVDGTTVSVRMSSRAWRSAAHAWATELMAYPQR